MLWYSNPEELRIERDGRGLSTVDEGDRLMRHVRTRRRSANDQHPAEK